MIGYRKFIVQLFALLAGFGLAYFNKEAITEEFIQGGTSIIVGIFDLIALFGIPQGGAALYNRANIKAKEVIAKANGGTASIVGVKPPVQDELIEVDWADFNTQVDAEQKRLINELKRDKKEKEFARWEAIRNVGRRFHVDTLKDLRIYADTFYEAALKRFQEAAGFNYWDKEDGRVPKDIAGSCGCDLLIPWCIRNNAYDDLIAVQNALERVNSISTIADGTWRQAYRDWQRTLFYVYQNIARPRQ